MSRRRWSLTTRLTAFYFVSVAAILVAFFFAIDFTLTQQEVGEDRELLDARASFIRAALLSSPSGDVEAVARILSATRSSATSTWHARILDDHGTVLAATPHFARTVPETALLTPNDEQPAFSSDATADGGTFRCLAEWITTHDAAHRKLLVQVVLDDTADQRFGSYLRHIITILIVVSVLVAAGLGAIVARSTLRPLTTMTTVTAQVTANRLRTKLDSTGWPVELSRLAQAFEDMLARLEESFERLSQFSANLSHELRTPINILRGEAEVALNQARTAEEYRAVLESSLEEYTRLSRLIDNLLFIARAESSNITIGEEPLEVAHEVQAVLDFYEALASEQGVALSATGNARLRSDSVLFRRMLSNLVANALRFTPRDGRITVSIARHSDGRLEVEVADTGCGIPAGHLARIYDRFYRVEPGKPTPGQNAGFGLGLSIVRSIMTLHKGTISVESEEGRSTRVRLVFPAGRVV